MQVEVEVEDSQVHKREDFQVHKRNDSQVQKRVPEYHANADLSCSETFTVAEVPKLQP